MKDEYIDEFGNDSLRNLKLFAEHNKGSDDGIFVTQNESMLEDREELEKYFKIKIMDPMEVLSWHSRQKDEKKKSG